MPREYHNLAGFCRDLRAASLAAAEGDSAAEKLCYDFDDALGLLDAFVDGDLPGGQEGDGDARGDDAEDEDDTPVVRGQTKGDLERMGTPGARATQHSTRARGAAERRPSRRGMLVDTGKARTVDDSPGDGQPAKLSRARHGGKR